MRRNRYLFFLAIAMVLLSGVAVLRSQIISTAARNSNPAIVITLGEDLSPEQKSKVMDYFSAWQSKRAARIITVSNQEERKYLQGLVDEKLIGTRAISCAYCEVLEKSKGIEVETHNISAITPFMYTNALATAGIENARVIVAAPFKVSGTAALTGITKAFETATGKSLSEDAKETANQEIAETSKLGKKIGNNNAEKIIYEVKRQVIEKNISDPEEIRKIILDVSADLNISLAEDDLERIISLMQRLNGLNINIQQINEQLRGLQRNLDEVKSTGREVNDFFRQLFDFINSIIQSIKRAAAA